MRIGIDARLYGTKHGGIGRYTAELIKNLEKIDAANDYYVFLAKNNWDEYAPQNPRFKKVSADFKVYGIFEQLLYPALLYHYNLDLVHFTHFNVPMLYAKKFIVTIHDLIISHYPSSRATNLHPLIYRIKLFFYDFIVKSAARRAKQVIAVSQFTKDDIVRLLKIPAEKIAVVYEGADLPMVPAGDCSIILSKLGVGDDYIMYVGSAYPHKNLEKLIEAFGEALKTRPALQLILVGKSNLFYSRLRESVAEKAFAKQIIFTGYLPDEAIVCLYKSAKLYVFPSLIEGFGLPPLEAQTYDLPVASSDRTCLPEILGESALYFDPNNTWDMAAKIESGLSDEGLRRKLSAKGLENVKKYSWRKMGEEISEIYLSFK
ncbi:MAG: glycosyltransferase family 1 protein [Patescibacteria group bacterium]